MKGSNQEQTLNLQSQRVLGQSSKTIQSSQLQEERPGSLCHRAFHSTLVIRTGQLLELIHPSVSQPGSLLITEPQVSMAYLPKVSHKRNYFNLLSLSCIEFSGVKFSPKFYYMHILSNINFKVVALGQNLQDPLN